MNDDDYHRPPILDMSRLERPIVFEDNWRGDHLIRSIPKSDGRVGNGNKIAARSGAKVTEKDVKDIRKMFDAMKAGDNDETIASIARRYGMAPKTVRQIGLRKTWKNVE